MKEDSEGLIERAEILTRWNVRNKHVLDIGAGPLAIIAARDFNCNVTNIDISEDALITAKRDAEQEGLVGQIRFEKGDATALSYPDRSFDVVISYGVLHHVALSRRMKFLQEVCRVAKEMVIVVELNADGFKQFHAFSNFTAVDPNWLEQALKSLGEVEVYQGTLMDVYTLSFYKKEPVLRKSRTL
ncbi:MAG: class I SAM-dependent methyltransferase [Candidatus Methanospirareceae archaeon]